MQDIEKTSNAEIIKQVLRVVHDKTKRERIKSAALAINRLLDSPSVNDPQSREAQQVIQHCRSIKDVLADL